MRSVMQTISVRFPPELKAWLVEQASEDGRSLNKQIIQILRVAREASTRKVTQDEQLG